MEVPPGFVPAKIPYIAPTPTPPPTEPTVPPPVPKGLAVPPPVVYKTKNRDKEPKQLVPQLQTLRVYYVGAIMVAWVRQWFGDDGTTGMALHTYEVSGPVHSVEEADRLVIERLRGKPREIPFMTTERIQGLRIDFTVNVDAGVGIVPLANGPEGFVPDPYERPQPISQPQSPDAPPLPMVGTPPPASPAPTSTPPSGEDLF